MPETKHNLQTALPRQMIDLKLHLHLQVLVRLDQHVLKEVVLKDGMFSCLCVNCALLLHLKWTLGGSFMSNVLEKR
jgi:hypothetical protein